MEAKEEIGPVIENRSATYNAARKSSTVTSACFKMRLKVERLTGRWAGTVILICLCANCLCSRMWKLHVHVSSGSPCQIRVRIGRDGEATQRLEA